MGMSGRMITAEEATKILEDRGQGRYATREKGSTEDLDGFLTAEEAFSAYEDMSHFDVVDRVTGKVLVSPDDIAAMAANVQALPDAELTVEIDFALAADDPSPHAEAWILALHKEHEGRILAKLPSSDWPRQALLDYIAEHGVEVREGLCATPELLDTDVLAEAVTTHRGR